MCLEQTLQHAHIVVLDVPPVFAKMQSYAVGTGHFGCESRVYGIGIAATARLARLGHVIDFDSERYGHSVASGTGLLFSLRATALATTRVVSSRPSRHCASAACSNRRESSRS